MNCYGEGFRSVSFVGGWPFLRGSFIGGSTVDCEAGQKHHISKNNSSTPHTSAKQ